MKLIFIGTRGNIEARTRRHRRHSSLLAEYEGRRVMMDCGEDWRGRVAGLEPDVILVTHAHPDHAWGLKEGAPCPVLAPPDAWEVVGKYSGVTGEAVEHRQPQRRAGFRFEAFPVAHSIRAPAVGFRLSAGRHTVFYAPDLVYIPDRAAALREATLYIGDGATLTRSFVRRRNGELIGHTPVRTQLTWCQKEGVDRAVITHCGSEIVTGDERRLGAKLRRMGRERSVDVRIAWDGLEIVLR